MNSCEDFDSLNKWYKAEANCALFKGKSKKPHQQDAGAVFSEVAVLLKVANQAVTT